MTTIEYDELTDDFYFVCHECGGAGPGRMHEQDADRDADQHDQLHDDEVI